MENTHAHTHNVQWKKAAIYSNTKKKKKTIFWKDSAIGQVTLWAK